MAQRHLEAQVIRGHLVENVVGGAVDDPHDRTDFIPDQGLPQGSDDRNRPRHRCLVVEIDAVILGCCAQLRQVLGQQRLVGGDHGGTRVHGLGEQGSRGLDTADHLDDEIQVAARDQSVHVRGEQAGVDTGTFHVQPAHPDTDEFQGPADALTQGVRLLAQYPGHLGTHHTGAEQRHLQWRSLFSHVHSPTSSRIRSSRVSRLRSVRVSPRRTASRGGFGT